MRIIPLLIASCVETSHLVKNIEPVKCILHSVSFPPLVSFSQVCSFHVQGGINIMLGI